MTNTKAINCSMSETFEYYNLLEYWDEEIKLISEEFQISLKYSEPLYHRVTKLILMLCPEEKLRMIFDKNCYTRLQLKELMNTEMLKYVELDFEVNPKFVAKSLIKSIADHPTVFRYKVFLLLANKGILAYLAKFDSHYLKGFIDFRWCLQFIYYIKRLDPLEGEIKNFLGDCERMFAILCGKCLIKEIEERGGKLIAPQLEVLKLDEASVLQSLLFIVIDCTDPFMMTTGNYLDRYILSIFFESLGEIERYIAFFKGSLAEYEYLPNIHDLALKVERDHLNDTIRRYILSLTVKLNEDPAIIRCIYRILECLLLYGGVHMRIIHFFYSLKEYHMRALTAASELSFDSNFTKESVTLLARICEEWETVKCKNDSNMVQLPQVLLKSMFGEFVIVDEVFDENRPLEHHHDLSIMLSSMKLKVRHKWFGETHTFKEYSNSMWKIGTEWVIFWKDCYIDNHGVLPLEMIQIFNDIK